MKTKKIMVILTVIAMGWIHLAAQPRDRFSIGPRGGVNFSDITNVEESQTITGTVLADFDVQPQRTPGLTLDVLYSVEGIKPRLKITNCATCRCRCILIFSPANSAIVFVQNYVGAFPAFFMGGRSMN
jgi:hypothetical protein